MALIETIGCWLCVAWGVSTIIVILPAFIKVLSDGIEDNRYIFDKIVGFFSIIGIISLVLMALGGTIYGAILITKNIF